MLEALFSTALPVIGVVHLPPLPGSPANTADAEACLSAARSDAGIYADAGVDALLLENHGDAPFPKERVEPHVTAFLAIATRALRSEFDLPTGVNCLRNDALSALAIAAMAGAAFIRVNVLLGATATDQGLIEGRAHDLLRYRRQLQAEVAILADVEVKFGTPLYCPAMADLAPALVHRGGADALIVTGAATGSAPAPGRISEVKEAAPPGTPVLCGSGVTADNLAEVATRADGLIVGSAFKRDGIVSGAVDSDRVHRFMEAVARHRERLASG
jgi:membrane complex biogenesis BtpA family protein